MKTAMLQAQPQASYAYHALMNSSLPGMRGVAFSPETGAGSGAETTDTTDAAAAEAAAAEEAAAAAAAEAAAQQELEEAEAAVAAAEDDTKDAAALRSEKAALLREVMDKKNKLRDVEKRAADAAAALAAYGGVDPEKVRDLLRREAEAERADAEAKGDFERVKAMMVEEHEREKAALAERIAALESETGSFRATIDELTVGNSFATSQFIRESLTLTPTKARQLYGSHFEVKDGKTLAYDKPAGSKERTVLTGGDGKPLSFEAAMAKLIDQDPDKDMLLRAKVAPGSGSATTQQNPSVKQVDNASFGVDRIRASFGNS